MSSVEAVAEARVRKLRPLWEAVDTRNWRQAVRLADKKDVAGMPLAKAMQALALANLGDDSTSYSIVHALMGTKPSGVGLCGLLASTLHVLGMDSKAASLYADAVAQRGDDTELLVEAAMAALRAGQWRWMQGHALKLAKATGDQKYMLWVGLAVVMQAGPAGGPMLGLAAKMVEKGLDGGLDSAEGVAFVLHLLRAQGQFEDGLAALDARGSALQPVDVLKHSTALHVCMENWGAAAEGFTSLLTHHDADDWSFHLGVVTCLMRAHGEAVGEVATTTLALLKRLQDDGLAASGGRAPPRAPFLAELMLECYLLQASGGSTGATAAHPGDPCRHAANLFVAYLERFGDRPCAFHDLAPFAAPFAVGAEACPAPDGWLPAPATDTPFDPLPPVKPAPLCFVASPASQGVVLEALAAAVASPTPPDVDPGRHFQRVVTARQLQRFLGVDVGAPGALVDAWSGAPSTAATRDALAALGAQLLRGAAHGSPSPWQALTEAAVVLEAARAASPDNPQPKVGLLRVYAALGAGGCCVEVWDSLAPRHIQADTMSYLLLDTLQATGCAGTTRRLCHEVGAVHAATAKDVKQYSKEALSNGHLSKVLDFARLRDRMSTSLQAAYAKSVYGFNMLACRAAGPLAGLLERLCLTGGEPLGTMDLDDAQLDALVDNNDYSVEEVWRPLPPGLSAANGRRLRGSMRLRRAYLQALFQATRPEGVKADAVARLRDAMGVMGYGGEWTLAAPDDAGAPPPSGAVPPPPPAGGAGGDAPAPATGVAPRGDVPPVCLPRRDVVVCVWETIASVFDGAAAVAKGFTSEAACGAAAAAFATVGDNIAAVTAAILAGKYVPAAVEGAPGGVSPRFLAECVAVCDDLLTVVATVVPIVAKGLPRAPKAKGKKGKGKAKAAAARGDTPADALRLGMKAMLGAVVEAASAFQAAVSDRADRPKGKVDGDTLGGFAVGQCTVPFVAHEDQAALRGRVLGAVRASWVASFEELDELIKDRMSAIRSVALK